MIKKLGVDLASRVFQICTGTSVKNQLLFTVDITLASMIADTIEDRLERRNEPEPDTEQLELDFESIDVTDEDTMTGDSYTEEEVKEMNSLLESAKYIIPDRGSLAHTVQPSISTVLAEDKEDEWDWELELQSRSPSDPYIIHQDEYLENEFDFTQQTVVFYAEDNILTTEDDVPLHNWQGLLGDLVFGHGSNDKNIVYIRNEKHHLEYEVLYDEGSYEKTVLRMEWDDQSYYEPKQNSMKFRDED